MMNQQFSGNEKPTIFSCNAKQLIGITHHASCNSTRGVVIVVGGPQYRVGSHRQFLLLARGLAARGIPVFRFDCRGMGDSEGQFPGFDAIDDDIHAAINAFCEEVTSLKEIVIWGLCDGASAASFYAPCDSRVAALVLVNPWIRTKQGEAKAYLKHYYLSRLLNKNFWTKVISGKFDVGGSFRSLIAMCKQLCAKKIEPGEPDLHGDHSVSESHLSAVSHSELPERFYQSLKAFTKPVLLILSGNDLTAAEFLDVINGDKRWRKLIKSKNFQQKTLPDADHTFSKKQSMDDVIGFTHDFVS